ncbi:phage tail tape measure protein [Anaerosporobacter faecicola]|uniref:phage tail tape measure protein n=1 Tax=Anaerosporobacter faecicola TaxID=2718714 RepID=UPI00143C42D9|nr:phage tail tape measure protein [Anaerosporobacter faecicola]
MASKENELAIKIAGKIEKSFYSSTKLTKKELDNIVKHSNTTAKSFSQSFSEGFDKAGAGFEAFSNKARVTLKAVEKTAKIAAIAIAAVATAAVTVGSNFESAFAGVKKTVNATDAEFTALEEDIRNMAKSMPMSAEEIAGIAEAAGQLGIQTKNISSFTKTMADLGVATNMTSEDAATQFARFANITGMAQDEFDELGSTVVALGNNMATTESEITDMAMRLAGAGAQVNMSESEILGFAAALSSVGIEAEAGGSAFSKVMVNMQLAVETGKNGLKDYAKVAGMTASEFQKAFKEDATGAIIEFVKGLQNTERNGMSAIAVLDSMGITEVRLRDALLRASNAGDLFSNSINIANGAWEDNVALTNEANQRYATFESRLGMFKNSIKDVGISVYQDMREPLADGLKYATDFVNGISDKMKKNNSIGEMISSFTTKIPTAKRYLKEFKTEFIAFADPFIDFGKWLIKNPNVVVSTLAGIGSVIATYKIAKGVKSVATSFSSLAGILTNPFAASITAVGLAIGGTVGLAMYIKNLNNEMKKENLAEHFGTISLSMEDLQEAAAHIIDTGVLSKMQQVMSEFDKKDTYFNSMTDAINEINKANWKVSIGMELSDAEKESYLSNVTQFISDTQETLLQDQYSMKIAMDLYIQDNSEGDKVKESMNGFYEKLIGTVEEEGKKLAEYSSKAFEDGMLDIDEATVIAEYMQKMSDITSMLSDAEFDAKLSAIQLNYSGAELTAESFQNLQSEIGEQVEAAKAAAEDSYVQTIAHFKVAFDAGDMDDATYQSSLEQAKEQYLNDLKDIELKATDFQTNTIVQQYGEELSTKIPEFQKLVEDTMNGALERVELTGESLDVAWDTIITDSLMADYDGLDKSTQAAISQLFDLMKPSVESLQSLKNQYRDVGLEIPDEINKALTDSTVLGAISKNEAGLWGYIANEATNSPEYARVITTMQQGGSEIPKQVADAVKNNTYLTTKAVNDLYNSVQKNATSIFSKGINVSIPLNINANVKSNTSTNTQIPGYATGGIITNPTLATFAEDCPEAAIPLDGSQNAISLWQTAGKMLGVYDEKINAYSLANQKLNTKDSFGDLSSNVDRVTNEESSYSNSNQIAYSPVMNFNFNGGTTSKEDILEATRQAEQDFEEKMDRYFAQKSRRGFKDFSFS